MSQDKPGLMDKVKGMVGGHKPAGQVSTDVPYGGAAPVGAPHTEKKGFVEKVKEKIPGTHEHDAAKAATTAAHAGGAPGAGYPATTGATYTDPAGYPLEGPHGGAVPKKEGLVAKVKDKLHM